MYRAHAKPTLPQRSRVVDVKDHLAVAAELHATVAHRNEFDPVPMIRLEQELRRAPVMLRIQRPGARAVVAAEACRGVIVATVANVVGEKVVVRVELAVAAMAGGEQVGVARIA